MRKPFIRNCVWKVVLPAVGLLTCQNTAWAKCADDWLNIEEIREGAEISLRATNLQEYPVTFSMRVRGNDFTTNGSKSITRTLQSLESDTVMSLRPNNNRRKKKVRFACDWTVGDKDAVHDDEQVYLFPYANNERYRLIQAYGSSMSHTGREEYALDFAMRVGTPVHAARGGVVAHLEESNDKGCWEKGCGKYANFLVILHDDGTTGEYYHLQKDGALVDVGQRVSAGEKVALSGNTGHTTMPHLHFAVYKAVSWGSTQSVPVRFMTVDGVIDDPVRFRRYEAVSLPQSRNET